MKVLFTGGRAPATLELIRNFYQSGAEIFVAESLPMPLSGFSRCVTRAYRVPAPRADTLRFAYALIDIVRKEAIELIVPTCEEIFHIAQHRELLQDYCTVFTPSFSVLRELHNKYRFIEKAKYFGLAVPETEQVSDRDILLERAIAAESAAVFKPVWSRFGTRVQLGSQSTQWVSRVSISEKDPWIVQERRGGLACSTWSVVHDGELKAHSCYPMEFCQQAGASLTFRPITIPEVDAWVETFVRELRFTGMIAFDFFYTPQEGAVAIECNPRLSSGAHLFREDRPLLPAFLNENEGCISPAEESDASLKLALLLYGREEGWWRRFWSTHDTIFDLRDPLPSVMQLMSYGALLFRALRAGVSPMEASTIDIEWNGEV